MDMYRYVYIAAHIIIFADIYICVVNIYMTFIEISVVHMYMHIHTYLYTYTASS